MKLSAGVIKRIYRDAPTHDVMVCEDVDPFVERPPTLATPRLTEMASASTHRRWSDVRSDRQQRSLKATADLCDPVVHHGLCVHGVEHHTPDFHVHP